MANSLTPLISEVINAIDEVRFDQYAFTSLFSKDFMPDGALTGRLPALNHQTTLTGFSPSTYRSSGTAHTVSGRYYSVSTIYEANADLRYSDGYSVGQGRLSEFEARVLQQKVREVLNSIQSGAYTALQNTSAVSTMPGCPNFVGTANTTPFSSLYTDIVNATLALNRNNVPEDNRFIICDLDAYGNLLNNSGLWNASIATDQVTNTLQNSRIVPTRFGMNIAWENKVGRFTGYTGFLSGQMYVAWTGTSGEGYTGSCTAYLYGSGSSGSTGAALNAGDVIWFSALDGVATTGYGQSYVVTSGATTTETGTGGKALFSFWPPLRGSGQLAATITPAAITGYDMNLCAHRDAMKLIMRDPLQAMGGRSVIGEHIRYVDPRTNVPLLISWYPGDMMGVWTVKALFQWVPVNPDYACIIAG